MGLLMLPQAHADKATGPLRPHPTNPRYFTDGSGKAIYLAGSQAGGWDMQDDAWPGWQAQGVRIPSSFARHMDILSKHNHNVFRLWTVESARCNLGSAGVLATPLPYQRTGPGNALDGQPRFDLNQFDPAYFDRLRSRVIAARGRGIYVIVMLFEGFSCVHPVSNYAVNPGANPWFGHPFNVRNNVNGVNGDRDGDGWGLEFHSLAVPAVTRLQKAYVRKVGDTVNDLDNVLYEIANESVPQSQDWQNEMINTIKSYEATKPKQHPVLTSHSWPGQSNAALFASPADAVAPGKKTDEDYENSPPTATGKKVVIADFDHINPWTRDPKVVWKNFLRGNNPIIYDTYLVPFDWHLGKVVPDDGTYEPLRRAVGHTRSYATRMNLAAMTPRNDLASTQYCLANPGREYLVYLPEGGEVTVDLTAASGTLTVE
ncbi:MAG: hypothetical protein FJ279_26205, partial [Planctomycetes bacterium]|nr:hypothetical protein [Planctomycetota bacterium]